MLLLDRKSKNQEFAHNQLNAALLKVSLIATSWAELKGFKFALSLDHPPILRDSQSVNEN